MQIAKVLTALVPLIIAVSAQASQAKRNTFCRSQAVSLPAGGSCNGQVRCIRKEGLPTAVVV
ncbi:hypothetical protein HYALB_00010479 [Hymenoscyphus albidus]|uniref:Uncharacterized protein n=1 Tax=Hymenoscyphus albidus TaxID=595503 RepID=A0A9N9Q227_9HELO|nr:hypothetical protein HYALB_00010479 [Hymenoscyphus albidus]